tara:strand:+ start:202 stop:387 length:186 start_codon:yes stop_codon:yes gene_type:complete
MVWAGIKVAKWRQIWLSERLLRLNVEALVIFAMLSSKQIGLYMKQPLLSLNYMGWGQRSQR